MKKLLVLFLALIMVFSFVACGDNGDNSATQAPSPSTAPEATEAPDVKSEGVLTYAQYADIEVVEGGEQPAVVIEAYVQAKQSWWDNKATVYTQDKEGAYFLYEMACSEEDYARLTVGTKIKVTGYKTVWAGEYEIVDATFEILEGNYVAPHKDVTALLGTEDLIKSQNQAVAFKGLEVVSIEYKNGAPGDDIYVKVAYKGTEYSFCVERYLTGPDTAVYSAVGELKAGDIVDIQGFLYWYNGVNTHITAVSKAA